MSKLSILHISDTHFGCPDSINEMGRITKALVTAVKTHVEKHDKPDICIFSGDLAYSGTKDQFANAEIWLKLIVDVIGDECPLFIVPGNHDVKRPNKDIKKEPKRRLRHSYMNREAFDAYKAEIAKGPCLTNFRSWHNEVKTRMPNIISDWGNSVFGCYYKNNLRSVPIAILGLNTAILSCDNDDQDKLLADTAFLNSFLDKCNPKNELIIVVSHHPIGVTEKDRWLADWNDHEVRSTLLQSTGPHLYFHGHLHETSGYSMNMMSGQFLSFFSAGAAYQSSKYPQCFSFYNINFIDGTIQPHVYTYDSSGVWDEDRPNSRSMQAVLPRLDCHYSRKSKDNIDEIFRELSQKHLSYHRFLVEQIIQPFGLDMLSEDEKRVLLDKQFTEAKVADLGRASTHQANNMPAELKEAYLLLENGKSEDAASSLLAVQRKDPERWKSDPLISELLLSALSSSKNPEHWNEAIKLLPIYGKAIHYNWLSYAMWSEGQLDIAVDLAEQALTLLESYSEANKEELTGRISNNLAYFYADTNREEKKEYALELIKQALSHVKTDDDKQKDTYALYLDTRGFIRIALGQTSEEIRAGIADCELARSFGSDDNLYFKHIAYASGRLKPNNDDSTKPQDQ